MEILVDILDSSETKLQPGPVKAISASVSRMLDGAGSIQFDVPSHDERALSLVTNEVRARINIGQMGTVRELGRGIVRKLNARDAAGGWTLSANGPDSLDELKRRSCWLNRTYDAQTLDFIVQDLIALVPGWTATVDSAVAGDLKSMRSDGDSVLKALQALCQESGLHLREGATPRTLEVGAFGDSATDASGNMLRITNAQRASEELYIGNDSLALLESFTLGQDSEAVANRIVVIGAGEGEAALTLKDSTRSDPYLIQTMTVNGKTLYYIQDDASIALYGVIEKVVSFKRITPVSNGAAAKIAAANALYDAASAWLQRNAVKQDTYSCSIRKGTVTVRSGDKVRLVYKVSVVQEGTPVVARDINDDFWVLSAKERVGDSGIVLDLQLSNIDKHVEDNAQIIVGALEEIQVKNLKVSTFPVRYENTYSKPICGSSNAFFHIDANFVLIVDKLVTDLIQVLIRFETAPLITPIDVFVTAGVERDYARTIVSTQYPTGLTLWINGYDVTSKYGGPWNAGVNTATDVTLDITQDIENAIGGIHQNHTIVLIAEYRDAALDYPNHNFGTVSADGSASAGTVLLTTSVLCTTQAILST